MILTSLNEWYDQPVITPPIGRSDHKTVIMESLLACTPRSGTDLLATVRSRDHNNIVFLAKAIEQTNWFPMYHISSCEDMANYFYEKLTCLINQYLPYYTVKRHTTDKPWVNDKFRMLIRRRQHALKQNNEIEYNILRNRVQRYSKFLRRQYYENQLEGLRAGDPRDWWQKIKRLIGMSSVNNQPLVGLANQHCDGNILDLASRLNICFEEVSSDLSQLSPDILNELIDDFGDDFFIEPDAVERRLSKINIHKSPGPDGLPNWLLRDMASFLANPICAIFNASVKQSIVPQIWKQANIIAVPKVKPPVSIETDLRPISLTPTLAKQLEWFVGHRILEKVAPQINERQFGVVQGRSTTHALVDILHHWHEALDAGKSVRSVFIDYTKAFDHLDHSILLNKCIALDIPHTVIKWLYSFLNERQQRVKIGTVLSPWTTMKGGMPQGTWLGPLMFIVMINDLKPDCLSDLFIDDVSLSEILAKTDNSRMNNIMEYVTSWSMQNKMKISGKKTKEMIIGTLNKNAPTELVIDGIPTERVACFKLLGVYISNNLKWNDHVTAICKKTSSRLYLLKQMKRACIDTDDLLCFYTTVVRPVLEYACIAWHSSLTKHLKDMLESQQVRAMHIIFNNIPYHEALELSNISSLHDRREQLCSQFFETLKQETSCLHHILPAVRDSEILAKLRSAHQYTIPRARTERFKNSFLQYALRNYQ